MKVKVKIIKEVELDKILVKAGVRYWQDCSYSTDGGVTWVTDEEDTEEESERFKAAIPFVRKENIGYKENDYWCIEIDVNTGKVKDWPKDFCLSTHFKVCDDGLYQILDKDGDVIWDSIQTCHYYVPSFLSIEDEGYGDYLYIDIDGDGNIAHWNTALRKIEYLLENDDD